MTTSVGRRLAPVTVMLLSLATAAPAQIGTSGGGPIIPGGQVTDVHPDDPVLKAERTRRQAQKALEKAQEYRQKGSIQQSAASFKAAITLALTPGPDGKPVDYGIAQQAVSSLTEIYQEGKRKLDAARKLYEEDKFLPALDGADKVKKLYGGILSGVSGGDAAPNLASLAVGLIHEIESDPKAIPVIEQSKAAPIVKRLARLDRESKRDPSKRLDVYQQLKTLAEKYSKCAAGRSAAERLSEIKKDASFMAWVETEIEIRQVRGELAMAEQFSKNGQSNKADAIYEKLLKRYPGKSLEDIKSMARRSNDLTVAPHGD